MLTFADFDKQFVDLLDITVPYPREFSNLHEHAIEVVSIKQHHCKRPLLPSYIHWSMTKALPFDAGLFPSVATV